jgi:hypothetical protein
MSVPTATLRDFQPMVAGNIVLGGAVGLGVDVVSADVGWA